MVWCVYLIVHMDPASAQCKELQKKRQRKKTHHFFCTSRSEILHGITSFLCVIQTSDSFFCVNNPTAMLFFSTLDILTAYLDVRHTYHFQFFKHSFGWLLLVFWFLHVLIFLPACIESGQSMRHYFSPFCQVLKIFCLNSCRMITIAVL